MSKFTLWRHGGRRTDEWRRVPARDPWAKFSKMYEAIRQGRIELRDEQGYVIRWYQAPRLRTRW